MDRPRRSTRAVALGGLITVALAACRTTGQKPDYVQPTPTPAQTASPSPSGPTAYTSTSFELPFTITLPAGWPLESLTFSNP
jgi:hypothetical protein